MRKTTIVTVLVGTLLAGCWYTRLTTSDQVVEFVNPDGTLKEPEKAIAVRAPVFMAALKSLAKEEIRKIPTLVPGTILSIEVFGALGMDRTFTVRPDGNIDYPLVGELKASGKTVDVFRQDLVAALSRYFHEPQVIVNTQTPETGKRVRLGRVKMFAVGGATYVIMRPTGSGGSGGGGGTLDLEGGETLSDALARTGLSSSQNWRQVATIRATPTGKNLIILSDLHNFFANGDLDEDIPMEDGDVVFVPVDRNTWLEELVANLRILSSVTGDIDSVIGTIQRQEDR